MAFIFLVEYTVPLKYGIDWFQWRWRGGFWVSWCTVPKLTKVSEKYFLSVLHFPVKKKHTFYRAIIYLFENGDKNGVMKIECLLVWHGRK